MPASHIELIARGILRDGDRLLLCRSVKHGYHYLPGGHVEVGESAPEALAREFLEETGLPVRVGGLQGVIELRFEQRGRERHEVSLVFHVEPAASRAGARPQVTSLEDEITFEWVNPKDPAVRDVRPSACWEWLRAGGADGPVFWRSVDERSADA